MASLKLDQIIEGDCVERMRALPAGCADLVFADPPYGPLDVPALLASTSAHTVVIENDRFAEAPEGWVIGKEKRYGTTLVTLLHRSEGEVA